MAFIVQPSTLIFPRAIHRQVHGVFKSFAPKHAILIFTLAWIVGQVPVFAQYEIGVENAFPHLQFSLPVDLASDGAGWLYVVEQTGTIHAFPNDSSTTETTIFLDLSDVVHVDNEAGLLSISFHPDFESNGYFYVYYMSQDPLRSVVSRFQIAENDRHRADAESELVILEIPQPTDRHNAGETAFGPDGYLYLSLGDGSMGGDKFGNAQNLTTLLGSIIRIDVDNPKADRNYAIPADNPFAGNTSGYREEIFAYGFRNPWKFSIDEQTGHMWVGDVGEETWEEVNFVVKGGNYGWPIMEGFECYDPPEGCDREGLIEPIHAYGRDIGRSVTGGYVYRGQRVPSLVGQYIFADWTGRQVFALEYDGDPAKSTGRVRQVADAERLISSFAVDEDGELYMLFTFLGTVNRFTDMIPDASEPPHEPPEGLQLEIIGPNPFASTVRIAIESDRTEHIRIAAYDLLGREVSVLYEGQIQGATPRELAISGASLPSGLYFIRAESGGRTAVERVVLAK